MRSLWRKVKASPFSFLGWIITLLLTVGATIYAVHLARQYKSLRVVTLANTSLVQVQPGVSQDIKIQYKDQSVSNLSSIQLRLESSGNQEIRQEDFAEPVFIRFPAGSTIVTTPTIELNPGNIRMKADIVGNSIRLSPALLNVGDRVIVGVLVTGIPPEQAQQPFEVDARIAGVPNVELTTAIQEPNDRYASERPALIAGFFITLIVFLVTIVSFRQLGRDSKSLDIKFKELEVYSEQAITEEVEERVNEKLKEFMDNRMSELDKRSNENRAAFAELIVTLQKEQGISGREMNTILNEEHVLDSNTEPSVKSENDA